MKYISMERFKRLTITNPKNILEDKPLEVEQTKSSKKKLFFAFA